MSLGMQWMALTCRATFSGPHGRRTIPFGVLTPGKGIGCNWTNVVSLPRLELSTSSMPSALAHSVPGGQRQFKLWDFLRAILRRIPISSSWRTTNSCSPQGVYQWNGGHPQQKAGLMWSWMLEKKVDLVLRVDGRVCLTTPLLRMHRLRGLVSGLWPGQVWHSIWGVPRSVCGTVWHWHHAVFQGCHQRRCAWCQVDWWTGEVARISSFASQLAFGAADDPPWRA